MLGIGCVLWRDVGCEHIDDRLHSAGYAVAIRTHNQCGGKQNAESKPLFQRVLSITNVRLELSVNDVIMGDSSATTMCAADLANVGIALSSNEESVAVEKRVSPEAVL